MKEQKNIDYYGLESKKDGGLKSLIAGRLGASLCAIAFATLASKYGVTLDQGTQDATQQMVITILESVTGLGSVILPIISKARERKK
jgi:hypothetical protein